MIKLFEGDSFELIKSIENESIDLVMTDVPYPDLNFTGRKRAISLNSKISNDKMKSKKNVIIKSENWCEWFKPLAKEIVRVLKPGGSFVTTINSKNDMTFYHRFVIWMCDTFNLTYVQDWIWRKQMIVPGSYRYTVRQSFDYIAHFYKGTLEESKKLYKLKVIDNWKDFTGYAFPVNSIIGTGTDTIYRQACKNLDILHYGKYSKLIPELFIKILTSENDVVLEPFNGSGTTSIVAEQLNRQCVAFEQCHEFIELACEQYKLLNLNYILNGGQMI